MKDEIAGQHVGPVKGSHRFPVLDALRGVAAVAVVLLHGRPYVGANPFPHGNLAVDFFFMLSGFVLTLAYQRRLDDGWSLKEFMKARVIRLYPLYGLGLMTGFCVEMTRVLAGGKGVSPAYLWIFLLFGTFMMPLTPGVGLAGVPPFPLNFPSWSLFSEVIANSLHAGFLRRRSWKVLLGVTMACAVTMAYSMVRARMVQPAIGGEELLNGTPWVVRVMMSYTMGMLLFRLWKTGKVRLRVPPAVVALLLLGVMAVPEMRYEMAYDFAAVYVIFPVMLLAGAEGTLQPSMVWLATLLGQASYAVYVLHIPVADGLHLVWGSVLRRPMERDAPWSGLVYLVVVFGLALWLDRVYDTPVRGWLQGRFVKKQRVPAGA
jgi:peptidoglycan/LPS O-acetylase OafA/YrhL